MSTSQIAIHKLQKILLKKLTLAPQLRFRDLSISGLESEHMNYHLKKLISLQLVTKTDNNYELIDFGKDYTNLLDDNVDIVEKQPKTSIIVNAVRKNAQGEVENLMSKRLRQPYYGKVGRISGKVQFGETFEQATARELIEETGLTTDKYHLTELYRKMRKRENNEFVQDVIFYISKVINPSEALISKTKCQENFWITQVEIQKRDDVYDDLIFDNSLKINSLQVRKHIGIADGY